MNRYEIPETRHAAVKEAVGILRSAKQVILTTHVNADGDGAGCEAALLSFLGDAGVEAWIVNPTPFPANLRFMVDDERRILELASEEAQDRCRKADLCVILDTAERSRIGKVSSLVDHLPTLVIDHHPAGGDAFEGASLRDNTAAAAGELVFDLLWSGGGPWTRSTVEGLYVALMTDTGSFRFSNVTSRMHRIVAELIERGASPDGLYREVYGQVPLRRIRLLREILSTLDVSADQRVAWISVPAKVFRELGCTSEDLDGIVDYPRELRGVEVGVLFRELEDGRVKVSLRSNGVVDVNALARSFGGGGHLRASGALVNGSLDEVRERVVAQVIAAVVEPGGTEAPLLAGAPEP